MIGADDSLSALAELRATEVRLRAEIAEEVAAAREEGSSWAAIGAALGMSRQAAHERFSTGPLLDQGTTG